MTLELQFKIKNNPYYLKYLRENSIWYKKLNREPETFKIFEEEVKDRYELRPSYKISKALDAINTFQNVLSALK